MIKNKPALGWNTWNTFGAEINEKLIFETVDEIVKSGLKDAGYEYIVIDDVWSLKERDSSGCLVADPEKFPHGMKYIADYIHSNGLKFGMYSCAGHLTCAGYPGSYEHEWTDAKSFAEWEVDFLKYDFCFHPTSVDADVLYKRMHLALANSGRDILLSACSWGSENTKYWIKETGAHMWRSTPDICDSWVSVRDIAQSQLKCLEYNGHGCFNDMDMLVVGMNGNGNVALTGCTDDEYQLHFSFWALMGSPLIIGCDVRSMSEGAKKILLNKEVIKINQDPSAAQPFFVNEFKFTVNNDKSADSSHYSEYPADTPVIARYLDNGDIAVGFFNFTDKNPGYHMFTAMPDKLGLSVGSGKKLVYTDLWSGEVIIPEGNIMQIFEIKPHACRLFRVKVADA